MKHSRTSRLVAACLALIGMLFMQLAVASYVCPGTGSSEVSMSMSQSMPGCVGMDKAQPALCHASAHSPDQSFDTPQLPVVHPFTATHAVIISVVAEMSSLSEAPPAPSFLLTRTTAPPIAIRHCCFRI